MKEPMREHIRQSNLIENVTEELEIERSLEAWNYLCSRALLSEDVILTTHFLLMLSWPDVAGKIRNVNVTVGGRSCPAYYTVRNLLGTWTTMMNIDLSNPTQLTPKQAHIDFEHIHPFRDGNGRTGRLLMWWHEAQLAQKPTLITYENRFDYYAWF